MAHSALLYFQPGALHQLDPAMPVLWQFDSSPWQQGPLSDASVALAEHARVDVIFSVADAQLTTVSLSRKQASHLSKVLPFMLEEQVLGDPEGLHYVAGKPTQTQYPVVVTDRQRVEQLCELCRSLNITMTSLRVDADVLANQAPIQVSLGGHHLLIQSRESALAVAESNLMSALSLLQQPGSEPLDTLTDGAQIAAALRQSLLAGLGIDLLPSLSRGRQQRRDESSPWTPWKPLMGLAASIFVLLVGTLWIQQWRYQQAAEEQLQLAQALFEELFPDQRATGALRRQFQGQLSRLQTPEASGAGFLSLLAPVAEGLRDTQVNARRMQFEQRDGGLTLDVSANDLNQIEQLQQSIQGQGATASIANYRNDRSGVTARLRVERRG